MNTRTALFLGVCVQLAGFNLNAEEAPQLIPSASAIPAAHAVYNAVIVCSKEGAPVYLNDRVETDMFIMNLENKTKVVVFLTGTDKKDWAQLAEGPKPSGTNFIQKKYLRQIGEIYNYHQN